MPYLVFGLPAILDHDVTEHAKPDAHTHAVPRRLRRATVHRRGPAHLPRLSDCRALRGGGYQQHLPTAVLRVCAVPDRNAVAGPEHPGAELVANVLPDCDPYVDRPHHQS